MKKIFAILRKEYVETRTESLVFLLIGLAAPYLVLLSINAENEYSAKELLTEGTQWLPAGALFALWINLVILAATAFSRERENGTLETLRRTVKDWRLAAAAKFGYVLISTAVMAAVFALVWAAATRIFSGAVVWLDFISGGELKKAGYEYLNDFPLRDLQLVLLDSFVWGIFWSGRVRKQVGAIFSAVLCAVATGWVVGFAAKAFNLDPNAALACRMALLAAVLAFAPVRSRFGFRDFARAESSSEPRGPIDAKAWQEFDAIKPGGRPISAVGALLERAFGSMSLYGATFAALMIELAFLFVLRGIVFMFRATEIPVSLLTPWALLILCSAFGSGLFADVRDGNSPVRQRLPLFPTTYWLCNAFAYAVVSAVLYATAWLAMPSDGWAAEGFDLSIAALLWALSFATLLWAAALKGSRVTVAFVSFAVSLAVFLLLGAYVWNKAAGFESAEHAVKASFAATFAAFVAASYITVRRKLSARRAPIASSVPLALVAIAVACAACWDRPEYPQQPLEELTVAKQIELESTETPEEYLKRVEKIKQTLEEEISERVFPKRGNINVLTVDELNDAALHLLRTYEATKLRAAAPDAAAIAETNFYNTLNKIQNNSLMGFKTSDTLNFLNSIPERRPTPEELAQNAYVNLQYGPLEFVVNANERKSLLEWRKNKKEEWRVATWNICQCMPSRIRRSYADVGGETPNSLLSLKVGRKIYDEIVWNLLPFTFYAHHKENEVARRALVAETVVKGSYSSLGLWPQSFEEALIVGKQVPTPKGFAQDSEPILPRQVKDLSKIPPVPADTLQPFLNTDGKPFFVEGVDGNEAWSSSKGQNYVQYRVPNPDYVGKKGQVAFFTSSVPATPLYDKTGLRLLNKDGALYYAVEYDAIENGRPIQLVEDPGDDEPPFPHAENTVTTRTKRPSPPNGVPIYCRVRAVDFFGPDYRKSYELKSVWKKTVYPEPTAASVDMTKWENVYPKPTPEEILEIEKSNKSIRIEPVVSYVDDEGKEIMENSEPKYWRRTGVFADVWNVDLPEYQFAFPLADTRDLDDCSILEFQNVGDYRVIPAVEYAIKNGTVYTHKRGILFDVQSAPALSVYKRSVDPLDETAANKSKRKLLFVPLSDRRY